MITSVPTDAAIQVLRELVIENIREDGFCYTCPIPRSDGEDEPKDVLVAEVMDKARLNCIHRRAARALLELDCDLGDDIDATTLSAEWF